MTDAASQPRRRSLFRRLFAIQNVVAVLIGLGVFVVLEQTWPTTQGALLAAACGGVASAFFWLIWNRLTGLRLVGKLLDIPHIGQIPATPSPTPTLTAPDSAASQAYQRAASRLEASTKGRVLLVSGMAAGQGATTASLNLAVAATRAGRRTILIDGDTTHARLSRFGRTGVAPGLSELVRGRVGLADAARLWSIDSSSRLPFIPAGAVAEGDGELDRRGLAGAVEDLTTTADLVLIDTAANGASLDALGTLADGTLLVLPRAAGQGALDAARARVDRAGAPAIGYVVNDAAPSPPSINQHPILRSLKRGVATALLILVAYGGWNAAQMWSSWSSVERQGFDVAAASELLPLPDDGIGDEGLGEETATAVTATPRAEGDFLAVLVVGTDLSENLADVIVLIIIPSGNHDPVMVSLPRDLYLPNRCTQSYGRINATLAGCGDDVTGASLLSLTVEDFTGINVDHFALFTFEGFERIIDHVGGVEICVDHPVRDSKSHLDLAAGCTQAGGEQALAWVRSRRTQELVDGRWRTMSNVSDLTRNERQQDVILQMFTKLRAFQSPSDLTSTVRNLTSAFELDDRLGITDAINLLWDLRSLNPSTIQKLEIPVTDRRTNGGAQVLVPTDSFDALITEVWPDFEDTVTN